MTKVNLTKANWKALNQYGLITGEGNGFACTTAKADGYGISKYRDTLLKVANTVYIVKYMDGCFYPIWSKVAYGISPSQLADVIIVNK